MYSRVGSCVSWLHANLQVLSLCHCSILNQFPLKKWLKKKKKKQEKNSGDIHEHTNFILVGFFFFWVLRKPQKIHPSFCVHMNGKVKQSSEKSKKKKEAFVFINGRRFTSYFGGSYFKVFTSLFSGMIDASTSSCIKRNLETGGRSLTANSIIFHESTWQEATTSAGPFFQQLSFQIMIIIHDFLYTLTFSLYLFSPEKKSGRFLHELFPLKHNQKNLKFEEKKNFNQFY